MIFSFYVNSPTKKIVHVHFSKKITRNEICEEKHSLPLVLLRREIHERYEVKSLKVPDQ